MFDAISPVHGLPLHRHEDTSSTRSSMSPLPLLSGTPTMSPITNAHGHRDPYMEEDISTLSPPPNPMAKMPDPNTPLMIPPPTVSTLPKRDGSLWFALQGPKGDIETSLDKLVSEIEFRRSTLSDFFKLVARRSGQYLTTLAFITFRCTWGGRTPIVVNRYMTEAQWNDIKENDILDRYLMEKETNTKRDTFRVWVSCGDTSNLYK